MLLICGVFAGIRRNNCCTGRRRRSRQDATIGEELATTDTTYNAPPFVLAYNFTFPGINTIAPEVIYASKESFKKQTPHLKALVMKRYLEKIPRQQEEQDTTTVMDTNTLNWDVVTRGSSNEKKSVLEEELGRESSYGQDKDVPESTLSDVILEENDDKALLAFEELLKSQTVCAICLEDFEEGCFVRILNCTHLFHSTCLRQWLTKSVYCPLCKKHVFRATENSHAVGRYGYRSLLDGSNIQSTSTFLTRNSIEWFNIERREYRRRGQSWQHRNVLTAFI